eukprot:TRINITY_DN21938_c0_g1_i1.p1 TRINITY_DN21938_c0_g1~~TRINITY_DN21938_c0_g1_i1.p1  ORF type:complete len:471 (-),score=110.53 TRINITY_DN21938_c0_g1_i1:183-1595(-)
MSQAASLEEKVTSIDYWRKLCPQLHVEDEAFKARMVAAKHEAAGQKSCKTVEQRLVEEGFAYLPTEDVQWSIDVRAMARGILTLEEHGWPPTFIAMYDEAWAMGLDAASIMKQATGNTMCMDIVGFMVDPKRTQGFSPHRDRQPEDWEPKGVPFEVSCTFKPNGMAKYVTLWAALTDANPDNSCLHFIPKDCDPGYMKGDSDDGDPLKLCFPNGNSYQNIRSLPVKAGGCTFHTHRTIHWGNRGRTSYMGEPRIALSFGFSTDDFEPPYFSRKALPFPSVKLRAALASAQVLNYATLSAGDARGWVALAGSMSSCSGSTLKVLHRVFQQQAKAFHPTYRKEIARKFVTVSLSLAPGGNLTGAATEADDGTAAEDVAKEQHAEANDSEDDDDALDAMLDAEAETGEILWHDDFDMLNSGDGGTAGDDLSGAFMSKRKKRKQQQKIKRRGAAEAGNRNVQKTHKGKARKKGR